MKSCLREKFSVKYGRNRLQDSVLPAGCSCIALR